LPPALLFQQDPFSISVLIGSSPGKARPGSAVPESWTSVARNWAFCVMALASAPAPCAGRTRPALSAPVGRRLAGWPPCVASPSVPPGRLGTPAAKALVQAALLRQVADPRLAWPRVIGWPSAGRRRCPAFMMSMIVRMVVVLPAPLGAEETKDLPFPNAKLTPSTALTLA